MATSFRLSDTVTPHLKTVDKMLPKAMLRGADVSAKMLARYAITHYVIGRRSRDWELKRTRSIAASITRYTARFRGRVIGGSVVMDAAGMVRKDARVIEYGGRYEQWVQPHTRARPATRRGGGFVSRRSGRVAVVGYRRMSPMQLAMAPLSRARDALAPHLAVPVGRAIEGVMQSGKIPTAAQLRKGLPR
jgi:hypothetical protein